MEETNSKEKDYDTSRTEAEIAELIEKRKNRNDIERKRLDKWHIGKKKFP